MDTVGSPVTGQIPLLENLPPHNEDGAGGMHVYSPWWLYKEQHAGKLDFARGYHIEIGTGRRMPSVGSMAGLADFAGGYGRKFKEDMRRYYGSFIGLSGRGEMIPNEDSYCEIDPEGEGSLGHSDAALPLEVVGARDAAGRAHAEDVRRDHRGDGRQRDRQVGAGRPQGDRAGRLHHPRDRRRDHGQRTRRSRSSISGCQSWDVKNLFITDGAPFPSNADKNPTLTIMALAWRAADYMLQAMKRREL